MSERERLSDTRLGNKNDTNEQSQLTGRVLWIMAHSLKLGQSLRASAKLRKEIRWSKAKKNYFSELQF